MLKCTFCLFCIHTIPIEDLIKTMNKKLFDVKCDMNIRYLFEMEIKSGFIVSFAGLKESR